MVLESGGRPLRGWYNPLPEGGIIPDLGPWSCILDEETTHDSPLPLVLTLNLPSTDPQLTPSMTLQCLCLRALRAVEEKGADAVGSYNPTDPEIIDLLSRDPHR